MARLHLSQPLCRRIRSSIVMGSGASFAYLGNDNYDMKARSQPGCRMRKGGSGRAFPPEGGLSFRLKAEATDRPSSDGSRIPNPGSRSVLTPLMCYIFVG